MLLDRWSLLLRAELKFRRAELVGRGAIQELEQVDLDHHKAQLDDRMKEIYAFEAKIDALGRSFIFKGRGLVLKRRRVLARRSLTLKGRRWMFYRWSLRLIKQSLMLDKYGYWDITLLIRYFKKYDQNTKTIVD